LRFAQFVHQSSEFVLGLSLKRLQVGPHARALGRDRRHQHYGIYSQIAIVRQSLAAANDVCRFAPEAQAIF
jgi:hypothetical protein